jgi:pectate lyase
MKRFSWLGIVCLSIACSGQIGEPSSDEGNTSGASGSQENKPGGKGDIVNSVGGSGGNSGTGGNSGSTAGTQTNGVGGSGQNPQAGSSGTSNGQGGTGTGTKGSGGSSDGSGGTGGSNNTGGSSGTGGGTSGTGGAPSNGVVRAFPGAEGFGAMTPGGRGGKVIHVTTLAASGPGSLQAAVSTSGPRIIVFDVSGVINGDITITQPFVTIAGQTAPGGGITIRGRFWAAYTSSVTDIIVRHVRIRPPKLNSEQGDAIQFSKAHRVIFDHVTVSWGCDETIDIYSAQDITLQWSTVEESDPTGHPEGNHNYGLINGPEGRRVSVHHNLFAHHRHRNPAIANGPADVRNNVIYDFRQGFHHDNNPNQDGINVVGNYYKPGPSAKPVCFNLTGDGVYYFQNNFLHNEGMIGNPCQQQNSFSCLNQDSCHGDIVNQAIVVPSVTTHTPQQAYDLVLAQSGAFPRDVVTVRTIQEVKTTTGSWGRHDPSSLMTGLTPGNPPTDSDGDGIPNSWESAHGLNPNNASDGNSVTATGYTAIEDYINEQADSLSQ